MKSSISAACASVGMRAGDAGREPDRVVPDEPGEVGGVPDVREEVEVLAERRPGDHRPVEAERVQPPAHVLARVVRDRRVAPAAVADDLGRHALADRALGRRVREQREVAVAVRVDEAGADDLAGGVDHARPPSPPRRAAPPRRPDRPRSRRRRGTAGCRRRRRPSRSGSGRRASSPCSLLLAPAADVRPEPRDRGCRAGRRRGS